MSAAHSALVDTTPKQLKSAIDHIGGEGNYQVKYHGKAAKSYIFPQSKVLPRVLSKWQECMYHLCKILKPALDSCVVCGYGLSSSREHSPSTSSTVSSHSETSQCLVPAANESLKSIKQLTKSKNACIS